MPINFFKVEIKANFIHQPKINYFSTKINLE